MNKRDLSKLSKSQLIGLLIKLDSQIQKWSRDTKRSPNEDNISQPPLEFKDDYNPIPKPRKSVKQMVKEYEDNIIQPHWNLGMITNQYPNQGQKPTPLPRTKIEQVAKALKGFTKSFEIGIKMIKTH